MVPVAFLKEKSLQQNLLIFHLIMTLQYSIILMKMRSYIKLVKRFLKLYVMEKTLIKKGTFSVI